MSEAPETVWLRDLDETGSMHVCSKEDLGAVPYVPLDLAKPRVRPLVWVSDTDIYHKAGGYVVYRTADPFGTGTPWVSCRPGNSSRVWAKTLEAAKSAAQVHHEATILGEMEDE